MARLFTWDEAKRKSNLRKHGLDFADAPAIFDGPAFTSEDLSLPYSERRFTTVGFFFDKEVAVTYTERNYGIRIISFRYTSHLEADDLWRQIG